MLMKTANCPVEKSKTAIQYENCEKLLHMIDNEKWNVDFDFYQATARIKFMGIDCGTRTYRCLLGQYAHSVLGLSTPALYEWCNKYYAEKEFGTDDSTGRLLFGGRIVGDMKSRRDTLVRHMENLKLIEAA